MAKIIAITDICIAHYNSSYPPGCLEGILKSSSPSLCHALIDYPGTVLSVLPVPYL